MGELQVVRVDGLDFQPYSGVLQQYSRPSWSLALSLDNHLDVLHDRCFLC